MGNEQVAQGCKSQPLAKPKVIKDPPMLSTIAKRNKTTTGFNSIDFNSPYNSNSPNSSVGIENGYDTKTQTFKQIITETLKEYKTQEVDDFVKNVMDDVSQHYETSPPPPKQKFDLSFIPKENVIKNIGSVFEYKKQLGQGASCRVLKARHLENHKYYAVKELTKKNPTNAELFKKEVQLLRKLNFPHILKYYNCYMDDNCYYIATEYCSGMATIP